MTMLGTTGAVGLRRTICVLACTIGLCSGLAKAGTYVYVSNAADKTISRYGLDESAGELTFLGNTDAEGKVMPLATSPDKKHLYASIRSLPYEVLSYRIHADTGALTLEGKAPLPSSMANIDTDRSGRFLFSASYGGSLVGVNRVDGNGIVRDVIETLKTGDKAHAIHASPDDRFVFSTSLGDDELMQYRFDAKSGRLIPNTPATVKTAKNVGPRHYLFSPDGKFLYVVGELSGTVTTFRYDKSSGLLTLKSSVPAVPARALGLENGVHNPPPANSSKADSKPKVWAADMHLSPNGRYLYVSERRRSILAVLNVDAASGALTYKGYVKVEKQPRGFGLSSDGRYLIVAGEKASNVGLYKIDSQSGMPEWIGQAKAGQDANWVEVVSFP